MGKEKRSKKGKVQVKKFIKENKKPIITGIIVIALVLVFFGYRIWLNVHFFITDDLVLVLEEQDKSLSVHYGERPNVTVNVGIENSFVCNAFCSYELRDLSAQTTVDKGTFTSKGIGKSFSKNFELFIDRAGSGQKLYSFDIQCSNIKTFYCPTDESKRERSVFITLNYDISEFEQSLKESLKKNITDIARKLSSLDIDVQNLNNKVFELGFLINLNEIEDDKEILNNDFDKIVLELETLERVWSEENYLLLSELFNRSYDKRIENVSHRISNINSSIQGIISRHNALVDEINNFDSNVRNVNETILFLSRHDNKTLEKHKALLEKISNIKAKINENSFESYESIEKEANETRKSFSNFKIESENTFKNSHLKGSYYGAVEKEKLCSIKGMCNEKTNFPAVILSSATVEDNKIENLCVSLDKINENYNVENNKSEELLKKYNLDEVKDIIEEAGSKKEILARKTIFDEIKDINVSNELDKSLNMLLDLSKINISDTEINYSNFSQEEMLSLVKMNFSKNTNEFYGNYCGVKEKINISKYYGNETSTVKVENIEDKNFTSRINIELAENYPVCCVFGECKRCCTSDECRKDESLYPILFLHGHSLNADNSPDYSLDAFNKMLAKLQEDGYIGAGTITPVSNYQEIKKGEWGLSSRPIAVKGSYYLVSYYNLGSYAIETQKSENIETYAIRLKELVDLLKFRTGRDKVNIIAHSMGGLVARSYLQIFGDEDVNKLIMVATPNKGISGSVSSYCPLLGEKKECNDMNANSIFIKKLNDPNKLLENLDIYNIVGVGCKMDSTTGDGIASKENAELGNVNNYFVNGSCDGFSNILHTNILDVEKYPEVYRIISNALSS